MTSSATPTVSSASSVWMVVDFGTNGVSGSILGSINEECCYFKIIDEEGPGGPELSGDTYFGTLDGAISNGLVAASANVTGTVDGNVNLLGGFTDGGSEIEGGIAGTIDGETMGGTFNVETGGEGER